MLQREKQWIAEALAAPRPQHHVVSLTPLQYREWQRALGFYWTMASGDAAPLLQAISELEAM